MLIVIVIVTLFLFHKSTWKYKHQDVEIDTYQIIITIDNEYKISDKDNELLYLQI
jgi:hypothetical protein